MTARRRHALMAAVAAAFGAGPLATAQSVRYTVTDLGTIPSSSICPCFFGRSINDANQVVGTFYSPAGDLHSFFWDGGAMTDMGTLGGAQSAVQALNNAGQSVGYSDTAGEPQHGFLFEGDLMIDVGTLGGVHSAARDVNDSGIIAGHSMRPEPDHYSHAFRWDGGSMTDLGTLGGPFSEGHGINEPGDIVGWSWTADWDPHAVLWPADGSPIVDLGTLAGPEGHSYAADVNDAGQIVGRARNTENLFRAILWDSGEMVDLGLLPEAGEDVSIYGGPAHMETSATAINSDGVIVGNSLLPAAGPPQRHGPFVFKDGVMTNLNDLLVAADSDWHIHQVNDINDGGVIVGYGKYNEGDFRAVTLTPVEVIAGDLNGDCAVNVLDLIQLLLAFGTNDPAMDVNGDGSVNVLDLIDLLLAFGNTCP